MKHVLTSLNVHFISFMFVRLREDGPMEATAKRELAVDCVDSPEKKHKRASDGL